MGMTIDSFYNNSAASNNLGILLVFWGFGDAEIVICNILFLRKLMLSCSTLFMSA